MQAVSTELTAADSTPRPSPPAPNDLLGYGPIANELDAGQLDLIWARAEAYADSPDRVVGKTVSYGGVPLLDVDSVRYNVASRSAVRAAEVVHRLALPDSRRGRAGGDARDARPRRQDQLLTNSLAATDEPLVHTAYRRYRPRCSSWASTCTS